MEIYRCTLLLFLLLMTGCQIDNDHKVLVALKSIPVYKTHKGDAQQEVFKLSVGDKCAVGRESVEKVFGYLEVTCPGKGYGWIVMSGSSDYRIVKAERYPEEANSKASPQKAQKPQKEPFIESVPFRSDQSQ